MIPNSDVFKRARCDVANGAYVEACMVIAPVFMDNDLALRTFSPDDLVAAKEILNKATLEKAIDRASQGIAQLEPILDFGGHLMLEEAMLVISNASSAFGVYLLADVLDADTAKARRPRIDALRQLFAGKSGPTFRRALRVARLNSFAPLPKEVAQ